VRVSTRYESVYNGIVRPPGDRCDRWTDCVCAGGERSGLEIAPLDGAVGVIVRFEGSSELRGAGGVISGIRVASRSGARALVNWVFFRHPEQEARACPTVQL